MNSVGKQMQVNIVGNEMVDDIHGSVTGYSAAATLVKSFCLDWILHILQLAVHI